MASKITVELEAHSAGWSNGLARADGDLKKFSQSVRQISGAFKGGSINTVSLASGVAAAGSVLNQAAQSAQNVATKIRDGASATEVFHAAVDDIPIVGQFAQAGAAINELVTGEKHALQYIKEYNAELDTTNMQLRHAQDVEAGLGKYGTNKAQADEKTAYDSARAKITNDPDYQAAHQTMQFRESQAAENHAKGMTKGGGWNPDEPLNKEDYTLAKQKVLEQASKLNELEDTHKQILKDIAREELHNLEVQRQQATMADRDRNSTLDAKALKEQGLKYDAERLRINTKNADTQEEINQSVSDYALAQHTPEVAAKMQADAQARRVSLAANTARELADVDKAQNLELANLEADHQETMTHIRAEARVAQLQTVGLGLEAEKAKIEETYRQEVASAKKRYADEHDLAVKAVTDAMIKPDIEAASAKKAADIDLADTKQTIEQRGKLWEAQSQGGPLLKYQAAMQKAMQDYQRGEINQDTLFQLNKNNANELLQAAPKPHQAEYAAFAGEGRASALPPMQPNAVDTAMLAALRQVEQALAYIKQNYVQPQVAALNTPGQNSIDIPG